MPDLSPTTPEALVNITTAGDQTPASIAALAGGGAVAVFLDASAGATEAKFRLYGADGTAASGEIDIGAASSAQAGALAGGGFAVTWIETSASRSIVHAQVYDAAGRAAGAVQTLATYDEVLDVAHGVATVAHPVGLHMTALADGGYAATWTVQGQDSMSIKSLGYQLVVADRHGTVETNALHATAAGSKAITLYDMAATPVQLANGELMVTWYQKGVTAPASGDGFDSQHAQLFDLSGTALGSDLKVDPLMPADGGPTVNGLGGLSVAALGDGHLVFAWSQGGNVEISIYPEDHLGQGNLTGRTPPQVVGQITGEGAPQLIALGQGGFAVVWSGTGDGADVMARVYSSDGSAKGAAFHLGDITSGVQDLPMIAAHGDGLVAIWRDASHLTGDPAGSGVVIEAFGPAGGDAPHPITGTAGADVLAGGAGEDWISGLGGPDTVSGGLGSDRFIFAQDGSPDRVLDFTPGQDRFLVQDASGATADGSHGAVVFLAATHLLSFDPDGGQGASPAVPLATLDGVDHIGRADLAAGFQPHAIKVIAADGSVEQTVFDWGSAAWDTAVSEITPSGQVKNYSVNNDDSSHWTTWFDVKSSQAWANRTAAYDTGGALTGYAVSYDDGRREVFTFDPHNAQPWARLVDDYDAAGHLLTRATVYDDGAAKVATFDVANSQPWSMVVDIFDSAGRLTAHWTYNDNGTFVG